MKRTLLLVAMISSTAWGGEPDDYLRFGGGFGSAEVSGTVHTTFQAFAGMDVVREGPYRAGIEALGMAVSDSGADGLGFSGLLHWNVEPDVNLFARAGVDFGGDSGWLLGAGVGYFFERNMEVRFETVSRQRGASLQFNLAWYPRLSPFP